MAIIYNSKGFLTLFGAAVLLPPFLLCILWYVGTHMECGLLFSPYPEKDGRYQISLLVNNKIPSSAIGSVLVLCTSAPIY